ncbi:hypothetical protein [Pelosinus sp. UFO1]|uniref:hypothetical protein n=1 Tax=Pelosinus sp. UFO1 TaxID=484770 RepID=UPI0004D1ED0E|nr:hypothetical protein [Pelosinus sp. UFO1]AIF53532.1 hypothetical protein UFO1_3989 [Pelosinus sp. UFO1]
MKCSKCEYKSSDAANFILFDKEPICYICSVYEPSDQIGDKFYILIEAAGSIECSSNDQIENKFKENPRKKLISKNEKKWLQKKPEYSWASQQIRERMEDIVFFSHRNKFQCNFMGTIAKIISIADEWYFDYTDKIFHLKHLNKRGKGCAVHSQKKFNTTLDLLQYIKQHDASIYRHKVNRIERLLESVIPHYTEDEVDQCLHE